MEREIDYYQLGHKRAEVPIKVDVTLEEAKQKIKELEHRIQELQDQIKTYEMEKAWTPPPGCTNVAGFYGEFQ